MDRLFLKRLNRERRIHPEKALRQLRLLEYALARADDVELGVRTLRAQALRRHREIREACLFCHGMALRIGQPVWVYPIEDADFDFVASWEADDLRHFAPVQLKEVVPEQLNPESSIQAAVDALAERYPRSENLTVAIHVNRAGRFHPATLTIPPLNIAALWLFGASVEGGSEWFLFGNMLEIPVASVFAHPEP